MKITIVENELYLAQSIQNNLAEKLNAKCEIYASYSEALESNADIYLVNTNLQGNLRNFITEKKDKIIILLVPYVTFSTVMQPIEYGADDYLQKPFSIEELIRKINHLNEFYRLKEKINDLYNFLDFIFKDVELEIKKYSFPIIINSNLNKPVEKLIIDISKKENKSIKIVDLTKFNKKIFDKKHIYICIKYEKVEDEEILNFISKFNSIILLPKNYEKIKPTMEIETTSYQIIDDDILSIEEYIKFVIHNYQYKFPDTELSKKLGISRKSLWEKRKKYGIFKQK